MKFYRDISKSKSYFYYFGWTILAFLGGFFLIFFLIFQARFYIRRNEKIEIFIAAHGLKDDSFATSMQKEFAKDGIVEVNLYSYLEDDINVYNYFSANGEQADFIIFSETNVKDLEGYVVYNYYDLSNFTNLVPSINQYDYYQYDNVSYGIKIYDKEDENYNTSHLFSNFIEFNKEGKESESYYLLVDVDSPHFNLDNSNSLGFSVLEYLLSSMLA